MSWGQCLISTFSVLRPGGGSGKNLTVRENPAPVTPSAWGRSALARNCKLAPADVAPSASAQVVRRAVARHSGLPSAARILATSSRPPAASFAVQTRPPCALLPLPGQPRPAGLALQSLRSFHSLQSFRARPRAGNRSGVGVAWAQPCSCGGLFWVPPPRLRYPCF